MCDDAGIDPKRLVLNSDNGSPMRGSTMLATLQWLGIVPSFSRPHVCDDNPYSEALFRTLKHTPSYPRMPFASGDAASRRNRPCEPLQPKLRRDNNLDAHRHGHA